MGKDSAQLERIIALEVRYTDNRAVTNGERLGSR